MIDPNEFREAVEACKEQGLVKLPESSVALPASTSLPVRDIQVTAENADEMAQCQSALVDWCKGKLTTTKTEHAELQSAFEHAVKMKWRADTIKRHAGLALKRVEFYEKMLSALEHGYQIVPSFPITAFAVRTDRKKPLRMYSTHWSTKHTQEASGLPVEEGEYKNPFPYVAQVTIEKATSTTSERCGYWASQWKELEFPITMSKPQIMEAATRAMALRIFDDLGILPGYAPSEGTRPPKGDPMILARIRTPGQPASNPRYVTFIVAWHLDTQSL